MPSLVSVCSSLTKSISSLFSVAHHPTYESDSAEPFMSISWLRKLVDVFLCCEAEFKVILMMGRDPCQISKPLLDRLIPELLERAIKTLDISNIVSTGVDFVRQCQKFAEITVSALEQKPIGDDQVKQAKKDLSSLLSAMVIDDKDRNK